MASRRCSLPRRSATDGLAFAPIGPLVPAWRASSPWALVASGCGVRPCCTGNRDKGPDVPAAKPPNQLPLWLITLALIGAAAVTMLTNHGPGTSAIPYSQFEQLLNDGKVTKVVVSGDALSGTLSEKLPDGNTNFTTVQVPVDLAGDLAKHHVEFSATGGAGAFGTLLSWVLPPLLFVGIWMFASRAMSGRGGAGGGFGGFGGGLLSVGRSRAKLVAETDVKVSFADVAGVDEAKDELHEIVDFLKKPDEYTRLGAHIPRGILLVGPPGTGKTLLARAVAGEAGVPFFSISGSEFVEMFVGVGAARVRDLFDQARQHAPAIIFIDELDALGRARGPFAGGGQDEKDQTLNQLLAELDGFDPTSGLVLLGATNRPEVLDPALLRAGRFDRQILVDRPDKREREQILAVHLKKAKLAANVNPEQIAALTPGFTGADLANLVNEATLLATRRNAEAVEMDDFNNAVERMVAGLEKRNRLLNPLERRVVAYHELGHAMVGLALPGLDTVHKVSIIPHGVGALGYTIQRPIEDRYLMTRAELEHKMAALLGGRASEQLVFDEISTGAADDLARATDIARAMVLRYGMSDALGHVAYDRERQPFLQPAYPVPQERVYSDGTAEAIDHAVRALVDRAFAVATAVLQKNRALL